MSNPGNGGVRNGTYGSQPLYKIVKQSIKASIISQEFKPNERIPTELQLMERFDVSRITVRRAIEELVEEGLLVKRHGTGTFVNPPKYSRHFVQCKGFAADCRASGCTPRSVILERAKVPASQRDIEELGVHADDTVNYSKRLRFIDDVPVLLESAYFCAAYDFMLEDDATNSINDALGRHDIYVEYLRISIEISYASKKESELLKIPVDSPVFLLYVTCFDKNDSPVYRAKQIVAGDKLKLVVHDAGPLGEDS